MEVSVIIPTHNRANDLKVAIESVLSQTFKDYEVLVVSDGSTDTTEEVMQTYKERDSRIRFLSYYPPKGGAYARNIGINNAKGEYVAFLDDDDTWRSKKLEKQLDLFKKNPDVGIVTAGVNYVYVDEKVVYKSIPSAEGDVSKKILISNCIGGTQAVVKKSVIDQSGGFDENLKALQDYDLWIRVCQLTRVATVKEPCINYYNHRGRRQISQITGNYEEAYKFINNKYKHLLSNLSKKEMRARENTFLLLMANKAMRNNSKMAAIKYIIKSIIVKPTYKSIIYLLFSILNYRLVLISRKIFRI